MGPDQTNTPSASTDVNDTPSNGSQPDATQGVSNPPDTPILADNQSGAQPGQNAPTTQQNQQPQGQQPPQPGQKPPTAPKAPQLPTQQQVQQAAQQEQLQHASHMRNLFETMAGGPRYKETIDPNTGTMTRTKLPMSRGDIGMMIAMEALSGGLTGLAQRGPGAEGRVAAAGFEQVQQQQKEEQENQDQQASADFTRHAQVMENNLRMLQIAQTVGQKDFDQVQKVASQYQDTYDKMKEDYPQYILGVGGEQDAAKYHATKNTAIPTGNVIPVYDPKTGKQATGASGNKLWQMEYAVIDPNFKASNMLTADDLALAKKYHVPGLTNSDGSPISALTSFPLSLSMALNFKHQLTSAQLGDQDLQDYYSKLGVKDAPDFADDVKKDPTLLQAMSKFQPLLMATGGNISKAIGELAAGGQGRQPNPNAAGKIMNLYGGSKMVQKYDQDVANEKEAAKKETDREAEFSVIDSQSKADAVLADPSKFTGEQVAAAQKFRTQANSDANNKAYGQAAARTQAEVDVKKKNGISITGGGGVADLIKDPNIQNIKYDPDETAVDGIRQGYMTQLNAVSPQVASLVKSLGEGRTTMSDYGLARGDGQMLAAILTRAYPDYDQSKAPSYRKMRESFVGGKDKTQIDGLNTGFMHSARAYANAGSELAVIPGNSTYADYQEDVGRLKEEINNAYTSGVLHEDERKDMSSRLESTLPWVRKEAIREVTKLMGDKGTQIQRDWQRGKPSSAVPDFPIISKEAQSGFQSVTGMPINQYGFVSGESGNANPQFSHVSASGKFGWNGAKWVPIPGK